MIDGNIQSELLKQVDRLPIEQQRQVLDFACNLVKGTPPGRPVRHFLDLAGTLDPQDAREMLAAIEEGCEQVDVDEW